MVGVVSAAVLAEAKGDLRINCQPQDRKCVSSEKDLSPSVIRPVRLPVPLNTMQCLFCRHPRRAPMHKPCLYRKAMAGKRNVLHPMFLTSQSRSPAQAVLGVIGWGKIRPRRPGVPMLRGGNDTIDFSDEIPASSRASAA